MPPSCGPTEQSPTRPATGAVLRGTMGEVTRRADLSVSPKRGISPANPRKGNKSRYRQGVAQSTTDLADADSTDALFRVIGHELRSPLAAILGYADLLLESDHSLYPPQAVNAIEAMQRNARREWRMLRDAMIVIRSESGSLSLEMGAANLSEMAAATVVAAAKLAERRRVVVRCDAPLCDDIAADPNRLAQVFDNLLTNAIKFSAVNAGEVEVAVREQPGEVELIVADNGSGVDPSERERIFEPRYRGTRAGVPRPTGSGLGLTVVRAIAEAHSGSVEVGESALGGAAFTVRLPRDVPADGAVSSLAEAQMEIL